ncbi:unnamed protein product [Polarella glacialis]|uniref:Uncharacterized protein n=1 Tax=Polarella glacialis TaxID=89957 RepID=A0A813JUU5_POLGL|nr:unnamed protein product [Polarella glacialis]
MSDRPQERRVALIGSTGGGAATLGHGDPDSLRLALERQLELVGGGGACVAEAVFVACDAPLDSARPDTPSSLWALSANGGKGAAGLHCVMRGPLEHVNVRARELDAALAVRLQWLDGVIAISTDSGPLGVNRQSLAAAAKAGLPIAGTGGTSLSIAAGGQRWRLRRYDAHDESHRNRRCPRWSLEGALLAQPGRRGIFRLALRRGRLLTSLPGGVELFCSPNWTSDVARRQP